MNDVVNAFHNLYYDSKVWTDTRWMGVTCLKNPLDLWIYQEIIWETRPDLIVETGTWSGGSALYLAHIMDLIGHGRIVTIDLEIAARPAHPRIRYLDGRSSTDEEVVRTVAEIAAGSNGTMVILDSDHSKAHVLAEIRAYHPLVTLGHYLIVEDTNVNGHPALSEFGEGPWEAVAEFLAGTDAFAVDRGRQKFLMTFNPSGYLRRVKHVEGPSTVVHDLRDRLTRVERVREELSELRQLSFAQAETLRAAVTRVEELEQTAYLQMILRTRMAVESVVPAGAKVAIVSYGDDDLLNLPGHTALHFPQGDDGAYAGHFPADDASAIEQVEQVKAQGVAYLVFPQNTYWWLEYYRGLADHLGKTCPRAWRDEHCTIYTLAPLAPTNPTAITGGGGNSREPAARKRRRARPSAGG
jgi:cephalosporin hydroxylase